MPSANSNASYNNGYTVIASGSITTGSPTISGNLTVDPYGFPVVSSESDQLPDIQMSARDENGKMVTMTRA